MKSITTIDSYKESTIKIARQLGYKNDVIDKIKKAKNYMQVDMALTTARKNS